MLLLLLQNLQNLLFSCISTQLFQSNIDVLAKRRRSSFAVGTRIGLLLVVGNRTYVPPLLLLLHTFYLLEAQDDDALSEAIWPSRVTLYGTASALTA